MKQKSITMNLKIKRNNLFQYLLIAMLFATTIFIGCSKEDNIDKTYPEIDLSADGSLPKVCSEIERGAALAVSIMVSDNEELGQATIDIHDNFDHHNHGTEAEDCVLDAKKDAINPLEIIQSVDIPKGSTSYRITKNIDIPIDVDPGNYHFLLKVTDAAGYQTTKGFGIKIK